MEELPETPGCNEETMAEDEESSLGSSAMTSLIPKKERPMEGDTELFRDDDDIEEAEDAELYERSLTMANCFPLEASIRRRRDPKTGKMVESVAAGSPMGEAMIESIEAGRLLGNPEAQKATKEEMEEEKQRIRWGLLQEHGIRVPIDPRDEENPEIEILDDWVNNKSEPKQRVKYVLPNMEDPTQVDLLRIQRGIVAYNPEVDSETGNQVTLTPNQAASKADGTRLFQIPAKDMVDLFNVRKISELWIEPSIYQTGIEYYAEHLEAEFRNSPMIPGIVYLPHLLRIFCNIPFAQAISSFDLISHYLLILETLKGKHRFIDQAYRDVRKFEKMLKDQAKFKASTLSFPEGDTPPPYFGWDEEKVHAFIFKTFGSMTPSEYTDMMEHEELKDIVAADESNGTKEGDSVMKEECVPIQLENTGPAPYTGEYELKPVSEDMETVTSLTRMMGIEDDGEEDKDIKRSTENAALETERLRCQEEEKRKAQIRKDLERLSHIDTAGMKQKDVYRWAIINRIESNGCMLEEFYDALKDIMHHYVVTMKLADESTVQDITLEEYFHEFKLKLCSNTFFLKDVWILQARYIHLFITNLERLLLILCQRWIPPVRKQEDMYNWDIICSVSIIDPEWNIGTHGEEPLVASINVLEQNSASGHPIEVNQMIKGMTQDRAEIMKIPESTTVLDDSDLVFGTNGYHHSVPTFYQMKLHMNWLEYCCATLEDESRTAEIHEEHDRFKTRINDRTREALLQGRAVIKHEMETGDKKKARAKNKRKSDVRERRGM